MKNKKLALLLAAVLTVTSIDSTVMIASGADFSSEAVDVEEESDPQTVSEETPADDADAVETEPETEFSSEAADSEVTAEGEENQKTDLEDGSEELFSDETGDGEESTSIVPDNVPELSLDTDYTVTIDKDNDAAWFAFTPEKSGNYIFTSTSGEGIDPNLYLYDKKAEKVSDWISNNDEGKGSSNDFLLNYPMLAGTTYYYRVEALLKDLDSASFTVNLTEFRSVASIKLDNLKTTLIGGFEQAQEVLSGAAVTVTYDDATSITYTSDNKGNFTDAYGNLIFPMWVENGEKVTFPFYTGMDIGKYGVCFVYEEWDWFDTIQICSNTKDVEVIPVTESTIYKGNITEGENNKEIQSGDVVSFTPQKAARYGFSSGDSQKLDILVETETDGIYSDVSSQNGCCTMEAGTTYYIQNRGDSVDSVSVNELPEVASVKIDTSEIKTTFLSNLEIAYAKGLKLTVTYKDGRDPETLTFNDEKALSDSYGNEFRYYFRVDYYDWDGEPGYALDTENYTLKVTCNDSEVDSSTNIAVTSDPKETLTELKMGENSIESPDEYYNYYWFSPSVDEKYYFEPASKVAVRVKTDYGYDLVWANEDEDGRSFYSLEKDVVYCIGFSESRSVSDESGKEHKINNWDITVSKTPCEWEETDRTEATCTEEGQITKVCTLHGEKETETIPATGHTPGEWEVTKAATAVAEGIQEQKCTVCDTVLQTKKIAKLKATIKLNVPKTLPLKVKQTFQIKASGLAKGDKVSSWKSSNTKIVTVTSSGKITGKKAGTATITVKLKSGLTSQVKVKVQKSDVAATSLTVLNKSTNKKISGTVTLKAKKKLTLATTVAPVTCKQKVTFTSSNKKIATVTSGGVITAKKKGTVTITVKVGKKSAKVKIKVN